MSTITSAGWGSNANSVSFAEVNGANVSDKTPIRRTVTFSSTDVSSDVCVSSLSPDMSMLPWSQTRDCSLVGQVIHKSPLLLWLSVPIRVLPSAQSRTRNTTSHAETPRALTLWHSRRARASRARIRFTLRNAPISCETHVLQHKSRFWWNNPQI